MSVTAPGNGHSASLRSRVRLPADPAAVFAASHVVAIVP